MEIKNKNITRLRRKPRPPGCGGMRVSFGGFRRNKGAAGSCPWGSTDQL